MIWTGGIGAGIAALCCVTPLLVVVFGALGLGAWLAWSDFVLFPALIGFLALAGYGLNRRQARLCRTAPGETREPGS